GAAIGLNVDRNPPGLAAILEHANLEMWGGSIVFTLVPVRTTSERTVQNRHRVLLTQVPISCTRLTLPMRLDRAVYPLLNRGCIKAIVVVVTKAIPAAVADVGNESVSATRGPLQKDATT